MREDNKEPEKKQRRGGHGRPSGMHVIFCKKCERRVTGYPRARLKCQSCGTKNTIPED